MRPPWHRLAAWALRRPPAPWSLGIRKPGPWSPGRRPPGTCRRTACPGPGPWAVGRAARLVRPGGRNLARDPWAVGRQAWTWWPSTWCELPELRALVRAAWCAIRGPSTWWPVAVARAAWCAPWWPGPRPRVSPGGRFERGTSTANPGPRFGARVRCAKALARFRTVNYVLNSFRVRFLWVHVSRETFLPKVPLSVQNALGQKIFCNFK